MSARSKAASRALVGCVHRIQAAGFLQLIKWQGGEGVEPFSAHQVGARDGRGGYAGRPGRSVCSRCACTAIAEQFAKRRLSAMSSRASGHIAQLRTRRSSKRRSISATVWIWPADRFFQERGVQLGNPGLEAFLLLLGVVQR